MQGRASKAPKKELVIESPQQYKSLAAAEAEVDTVPQVVVSHSRTSYTYSVDVNGLLEKLCRSCSDVQVHRTAYSAVNVNCSHKVAKQVSGVLSSPSLYATAPAQSQNLQR